MKNISHIASKTLGSANSYAVFTDKFDPSLLNPMPRNTERDQAGIKSSDFIGFDTWHCHEATFLLNSGAPIAGTLKFCYSSDSEFMVESKSAKLYLNTFDMCKMGKTVSKAIKNYESQVEKDLSKALKTEVQAKFFKSGADKHGVFPCNSYIDLQYLIGEDKLEKLNITDYKSEGNHLEFENLSPSHSNNLHLQVKSNEKEIFYKSSYFTNALRSRCCVTMQKDTGSAYITIVTKNSVIKPESLFKQIVSLREVNKFHEFCAEKLYSDIMKHEEVAECCVTLLYARRGSLDINPIRSSRKELIHQDLIDPFVYTTKAMCQ